MWKKHLSSTPSPRRNSLSAGINCFKKSPYAGSVALTCQPNMYSPLTTIFGEYSSPHWENRWDISKYFIPFSRQSFIQCFKSVKSKLYIPSFSVILTSCVHGRLMPISVSSGGVITGVKIMFIPRCAAIFTYFSISSQCSLP